MRDVAAIIPAGGASSRFGGGRNKLLADLCGQPVLLRTLRIFLEREDAATIVVPAAAGLVDAAPAALRDVLRQPRVVVCDGGPSRAHSVRNALERVPREIEWVAVHDAARPLISAELIDRTLAAAREHGAAVPALPVQLTIKQAAGPLPARVMRTVPRQELWAMQTPQIMLRAVMAAAFASCPIPLEEVTDDVQLIELAGGEVWLVCGEERNLKITTAMDLGLAEMLLGAS